MVKVSIEVHSKTAYFAVAVQAHNIQRALSIVAARYPGSVARVMFPIEPEGFFVEDIERRITMTTKLPLHERNVSNVVKVVGENLMVDVGERTRINTLFLPTLKFPLKHVLGAEVDPYIQRKYWKAWVLPGASRVPEPGVRFYNPRLGNRHKAIVIFLEDDVCERLVVEVQDPAAVAAMINEAVRALAA